MLIALAYIFDSCKHHLSAKKGMVYLLWIIRLNIIMSQVLPSSSFQLRSSTHRFYENLK